MTAAAARFAGLIAAVGCGGAVLLTSLVGASFLPGPWYDALPKPPWTPPDWVFGPVWSLLYVAIGVAGWLLFTRDVGAAARALWVGQLLLNALWSWLFFGLQRPDLALVDIALLLAAIVFLLVLLASRQRLAFWLLMPYAAWVGYALTLNAGIVWLTSQ